jgi:transcriptional regulator with XRE-family HTH domain
MKKQKIVKEIIYEGLGFPIVLQNVPMIELRGIWTPDIDLNALQKVVLLALAHHPVDLTGNQIRFIRTWLGLTKLDFGKLFGVTHPAIVKWEKTNNSVSKMNLSTQRDLRLYLLDQLLTHDEDFRKAFKIIHKTKYTNKIDLLKFDVPIDLMAV